MKRINGYHIAWIATIIAGSTLAVTVIPQDWLYLFGFIEGNISLILLRLAGDK